MFRLARKRLRRRLIAALSISLVGLLALTLLVVLPVRWINPPVTAFMLRDEHTWQNLRSEWVAIETLPGNLPMAVIAAEDQLFFDHYGFDFKALKQALTEDRKRRRGASTITQQLVKNLYLSPSRSLWRKGLEAYLTVFMELLVPKSRILELYINCVEFGPGTYGAGQASTRFFKKKPQALTLIEASRLAAVLPNPKKMSAHMPSEYVYQRSADIRRSISALGGIGFLPWKS